MGPDGDSAGATSTNADGGSRTKQELADEEVAQDDPGWQPHKPHEEEWHDGKHLRARVQEEVGAHYSGDGSAGADSGGG